MIRSLAPTCAAVALLVLTMTTSAVAKPCSGTASVQLEELMPRASVALDLAGTDQVANDSTGHCIGVQVRSYGTARLVKLILRGVEVPRQAVELRVAEVKPVGGV